MSSFKIYPLSEGSITIEFGAEISIDINRKVIAFHELVLNDPFEGFIEAVAAYSTVTIFYDPVVVLKSGMIGLTPYIKIKEFTESTLTKLTAVGQSTKKEVVTIPVCYDEEFAPDLQWLSDFHKLTIHDIIQRHSNFEYTVFMIGFMPGFPYMGILPSELESPRKQTPRTLVPAGSVGIAGKQTGIYPFDSPGGWQIIGRTPLKLFSPHAQKRSLLHAGDRVRFTSVSKDEFIQLSNS